MILKNLTFAKSLNIMGEFDDKARGWDLDEKHINRARAIAEAIKRQVSYRPGVSALEYGAGTGLLSFELKDYFSAIVLMDNSAEMIRVCEEKVIQLNTPHIKPVLFDLEKQNFGQTFDVIFNQMVLHHVTHVNGLLKKFYDMLNTGGLLIIADLEKEDGTFHGPDVNVHHGFEPEMLMRTLAENGFSCLHHSVCYHVRRNNDREYPVFLLIAVKNE